MDPRKSFVPMKGAMPATAKPPQALYDEAQDKGWIIIGMKDDWSRVFSFEGAGARALE